MASQVGGALAPLLVVPIQMQYGWRASFFVFGSFGILWAAVWYFWFRDSPGERTNTGRTRQADARITHTAHHAFPWRAAFRSQSLLALIVIAFCYVYVYNFFQTWFHTFLVKGRGFSEAGLLLSALPYAVGACANLSGGVASDFLVRWMGPTYGRRVLGVGSLTAAGVFTTAVMFTGQPVVTVILLALAYGAITFQQSGVFGVCLDIGHENAGAVIGLMNTGAQVGGLLGSVAYGYIVERFGSYDAPLVPMAALLFLGAVLWLRVDASKEINPEAKKAHARAESANL
jgi:predicted MFS family arabinose efflux permease